MLGFERPGHTSLPKHLLSTPLPRACLYIQNIEADSKTSMMHDLSKSLLDYVI